MTFKAVLIAVDMPKTMQNKCKTCFGGPRMILRNSKLGPGFMMSSYFQLNTIIHAYLQLFTERYGGACDWEMAVDCGDRPVCDDCDDNCQPHHGGK